MGPNKLPLIKRAHKSPIYTKDVCKIGTIVHKKCTWGEQSNMLGQSRLPENTFHWGGQNALSGQLSQYSPLDPL